MISNNEEQDFFVTHRDLVMAIREALLNVNTELEKKLGIFPTTSEIRRLYKQAQLAEKKITLAKDVTKLQ